MKQTFTYGRWFVEYDLEDGARLSRLMFNGIELLTKEPITFKAPETDYGEYETRPVYGYDDCFPTVEESFYPDKDWKVPDHGELCWLPWECTIKSNRLVFSVQSKQLPVRFHRILEFGESELTWRFEVFNEGNEVLPFQHVIHPLMKLDDITDIELPGFDSVNNERGEEFYFSDSGSVKDFLLGVLKGDFHMLFIQGVKEGKIGWTFENKLKVCMEYPSDIFPTIGIWWNNSGYPDEEGCRRNECAFEPIPGKSSTLEEAHEHGLAMVAKPARTYSWEIVWKVTSIH